jgi:DNA-binding CsgD family transcriptional regulator
MPAGATGALETHLEQLRTLHSVRRRLGAAPSVGALFAEAAELACSTLGFERAVVLSVEATALNARSTDSLRGEASDRMRREVLADPIVLRSDSAEANLIRRGRATLSRLSDSQLATKLSLAEYVLAPVAPETRALAVLVVDRAEPEVSDLESVTVMLFADCVAVALERVVVRARQLELAGDIQHLTASTHALMREVLESPVVLPDGDSAWPAFPLSGPIGTGSESKLHELLSESEAQIAALLVQGRSNREIADEVFVSQETVKASVARILRKLGAANRVEAVATILRFGGPSS